MSEQNPKGHINYGKMLVVGAAIAGSLYLGYKFFTVKSEPIRKSYIENLDQGNLKEVMMYSVKKLSHSNTNSIDEMLTYLSNEGFEKNMWDTFDKNKRARLIEDGWYNTLNDGQRLYLSKNNVGVVDLGVEKIKCSLGIDQEKVDDVKTKINGFEQTVKDKAISTANYIKENTENEFNAIKDMKDRIMK